MHIVVYLSNQVIKGILVVGISAVLIGLVIFLMYWGYQIAYSQGYNEGIEKGKD